MGRAQQIAKSALKELQQLAVEVDLLTAQRDNALKALQTTRQQLGEAVEVLEKVKGRAYGHSLVHEIVSDALAKLKGDRTDG